MPPVYSSYQESISLITEGGLVVMPTDTIYGVVASAFRPEAVKRLYILKRRASVKPVIILIADLSQLEQFSVTVDPVARQVLDQVWPGPTSVILPCSDQKLAYLHRGGFSLAFRLPDKPALRAVLERTGPLVAPSANPEGASPATTVDEARAYFGNEVEAYVDGGTVSAFASRLLRVHPDGSYDVLRP
ncbi:MAG TPA: L-threonylcarbamoyladenylate synthase [Candidatus Polarisedimenticolaceae bacterium]|nr:L-threonylcarbamoyladenylate synthase [Candidatus Polarisedimenticolaceae bacterium]